MQIEIPEPLLKRLQAHATPFIDTPVSVIERWGDFYDLNHKKPALAPEPTRQTAAPVGEKLRQLDPNGPPNLFHTTVRGEFGGQHFSNWNDLLRTAHIAAFKQAKSFEELRRVTRAQISPGSRSDSGYHFLAEIGVSLQNVDADHAWEYALRLATYLKVPLRAVVEWRHNDKAAHPGERAALSWTP